MYLKCIVPKESPIVFRNGSNYDCHFNIKELEEKFEGLLVYEKILKNK